MSADIVLTNVSSQAQLFDVVASHLEKLHYVTSDYKEALKSREKEFPTGLKIDYRDGSDVLYAAIPHTETKYCLKNKVVYVKNESPLVFKHMIDPSEDCLVRHFFFIINSKNDGQTKMLSHLISFFIEKGNMEKLDQCGNNPKVIKNYLVKEGVLTND
ncbi:PTS sugar transporter subunit IIA [Streptococcus pseudoporcinus]|uniref:PTS system transporter subunit IIA n=1 Tax=Streptococcus pseudoporcinus TaxID=361101 RepID=A0A4U9Y5F6_9STRE|nr:PTS sugar transporter subunit IIA [Streptococcus pseudoporcinus]VTS21098.1 PTS system transporter subunit IIA [Streptococcus pseudoporcinus]VUC69434.1 PTS system transporter subunit IIA [Streptococcus pseudoporcinus]VUC99850.1 PTS system transporter subunit IIA [Streptococcus pseudoporcinus]VUD00244.1 PTS system transporter subunit IIA [Streptococcus pseudoporcinus]